MKRPRLDRLLAVALLLLASVALLPNLGNRRLWQDEAETALVAKNILSTGRPSGWDGRLLVSQMGGRELTDSFLWAWTPWAMHYVAAAGMSVGGVNELGARWPFAVLGSLSFPLLFHVVRRMTGDRRLAVLTSVILLSSVEYLLLMRQCRYYALLPVFFLIGLWGYDKLPAKGGIAMLALGLVGLFHSNGVSCAIAASGLALHAVIYRRRDPVWRALALCGAILVAGSAPWLLVTGLLDKTASQHDLVSPLAGTAIMSNRYLCPWLVLLGLCIRQAWTRRPFDRFDGLFFCLLAPVFVFLPWLLWPNPRYVAFLIPMGAWILAGVACALYERSRPIGVAFAAAAIVSNVLVIPIPALVPAHVGREQFSGELETGSDALALGWLKSEWGGYLYELTHAARGPDEELVAFVESRTQPDDLVYVTNDGLPVMFHTGRRLAGVMSPRAYARPGWDRLPAYLADATRARWLVLRPHHPLGSDPSQRVMMNEALRRSGVRVVETIHLDINDVKWINNPLLSKHFFRTPPAGGRGVDVLRLAPIDPSRQ